MATTTFTIPFVMDEKVYIDGDNSITTTVVGAAVYGGIRIMVNLAWIHNGTSQEGWFDVSRLSSARK